METCRCDTERFRGDLFWGQGPLRGGMKGRWFALALDRCDSCNQLLVGFDQLL